MKEYSSETVAHIRCLVGKAKRAKETYVELSDDEHEAVEMAIKAIHKQIALKPNFDVRDMFYKCPVCGLILLADDEIPRTDGRANYGDAPPIDNYCSVCGQKIDWEGINDD